jgi:hypothetical protein
MASLRRQATWFGIWALGVCAVLWSGLSQSSAQEPYYKGKRLTVLINFAAGGPADISAATSRASRASSCRTWTAPAA